MNKKIFFLIPIILILLLFCKNKNIFEKFSNYPKQYCLNLRTEIQEEKDFKPEQKNEKEVDKEVKQLQYKEKCNGSNYNDDPTDKLLRTYLKDHYGSIKLKKPSRNAWSKNPNNLRYEVPIDMVKRTGDNLDSYYYPIGKINHISPDIRGNLGWRWYKDGKFQTSSNTARTGGIINSTLCTLKVRR